MIAWTAAGAYQLLINSGSRILKSAVADGFPIVISDDSKHQYGVVTSCDLVILSVEEELLQHQDVVVPEDWVKGKYLQDTNSVFFKTLFIWNEFPLYHLQCLVRGHSRKFHREKQTKKIL